MIKRASIFTNDPRTKVETVAIKAFVKALIYISPRFVNLNGPASQTVVGIVSVSAGEERSLMLEESSFDLSSKVTYAIEEVETGRFYRIRFTSIPGPPGTFRGVLRLKTNYPERPQIAIPITARFHGVAEKR